MRRCGGNNCGWFTAAALLFGAGLMVGLLFPLAPLLFIFALVLIAAATAARRF